MKEYNQILLDLKRRIFRPVYFLSGEEPYYIDAISDHIENNVLDDAERGFNQVVVYGKDTNLTTIIGLARQFPMMGEQTVVIVKEAQNLRELGKTSDAEDDDTPAAGGTQQLLAYVKNPQPTTILVFCYKYKTIDKRSSLAKTLQKSAVYFESKKLYDNQVPEWITEHVKGQGFRVSPRAVQILADSIGNDLSRISTETEKLVIGLQPGAEITTELVQEKVGISKDFNVFELQSALSSRDILKANRIVSYFASNEKEHPLALLLAVLYGYFGKILKYHYLQDKSKFAAAQALGVNPFFVEDYARAAGTYPPGKLKHIFGYLKECDLRSKGIDNSNVSGGNLLKEMIFKILH